ncbi:hypothetical protein LY78DRAFT_99852 [Colletotrichum sublineola]|nr:hypothetical protein LY78DRAFT_99852 [Colletotrichum sublineola]
MSFEQAMISLIMAGSGKVGSHQSVRPHSSRGVIHFHARGCACESSLNSQEGLSLFFHKRKPFGSEPSTLNLLKRTTRTNTSLMLERLYHHVNSLTFQQPVAVSDIAHQRACAVEPPATVENMPPSGAVGHPLTFLCTMPAEIGPMYVCRASMTCADQ